VRRYSRRQVKSNEHCKRTAGEFLDEVTAVSGLKPDWPGFSDLLSLRSPLP
jgi:hypothetical protein